MQKIKVLGKEIEVPEEIYYLLKKEADDEFQWDFQQYIDVNLGLKWKKYFEGTQKKFTAEDILKIDARDLACRYWIELERRADDEDCGDLKDCEKDHAARADKMVDKNGHINETTEFSLEDLKAGFEAHETNLTNLQTLLEAFAKWRLRTVNAEIKVFFAELDAGFLDGQLEGFCAQFPFSIREGFFFLAGLHTAIKYETENL
jgi:hypothetical protein